MTRLGDPVGPRSVVVAKVLFALYEHLVLGFSNRFAWKCPTRRLQDLYDRHASANHLEAGVGTGYFLNHCRFASIPSRLVLLDRNTYTLAEVARRLSRYHPEAYGQDLLQPLDGLAPGFDSVGFNYVLHCLPGTMEAKRVVFEHLAHVMNPGAVLFGSTTLYHGVRKNMLARALMATYNAMGIFCSRDDSVEGLRRVLARHFAEVRVELVGCSGLFVCKKAGQDRAQMHDGGSESAPGSAPGAR